MAESFLMEPWQRQFCETYNLDTQYVQLLDPVTAWLQKQTEQNSPLCLGISGSQGSGKSTLAGYLKAALVQKGLRVDCVSLDDFYLSRAERAKRARAMHPLFQTRGVPGTHDTTLAAEVLARFRGQQSVILPRFDKSMDEPFSSAQWQHCNSLDVLIFEGWCLGIKEQPEQSLTCPINQLEQEQDPDGRYRHSVNRFLKADYQPLFAQLDKLIFLNAGDFSHVARWRLEQEQKLRLSGAQSRRMSQQEITHFVQFFQRLTQWGIQTLPAQCDVELRLSAQRDILTMTGLH